jgi:putative endonuclease
MSESTRDLGALQEQRALTHLMGQGMQLLQRNFSCKVGEIDLIMRDQLHVVFVEVRYRKAGALVDGLSTVGDSKRKRFIKAVKYYLLMNPQAANLPLRFDVVSVSDKGLDWHANAFDAGSGW